MSWTISKSAIDAADIRVEMEAAADAYEANFPDGYSPEVQEQIDAAIECAEQLQSCVGTGKLNVSLSGHANPEHKPHPSYANDTVMVSVSNADERHLPDAGDEAAGVEAHNAKIEGTGAAQ